MSTWLSDLLAMKAQGMTLTLNEAPLTGGGRVLSLAPHPDDPDAVAVTLRLLRDGGWDVYWAILSTSWLGVLDDFVGSDRAAKAAARVEEQRASARLFGLADDHLTFLLLTESDGGQLEDTP